jgi:hypothetical protein
VLSIAVITALHKKAETGIMKAEILRQRDAKRSSASLTGIDVIKSD